MEQRGVAVADFNFGKDRLRRLNSYDLFLPLRLLSLETYACIDCSVGNDDEAVLSNRDTEGSSLLLTGRERVAGGSGLESALNRHNDKRGLILF